MMLLLAGALGAQDARLSSRAARAHALHDSLEAVDAAARSQSLLSARRGSNGPILVVLRGSDDQATAEAVAALVGQSLREFQVFPESTLAPFALVDDAVASRGDVIDGRQALVFSRPGGTGSSMLWSASVVSILADAAVWVASEGLLRDSLAREWLDRHLDPRVDSQMNSAVVEELAIGQWSVSRRCLGGDGAACALYLGIDSANDVAARFAISDIRTILLQRGAGTVAGDSPVRRCVAGDDAACLAMYLPAIAPAGGGARHSLVHFVRDGYGVDAARILLTGTGEPLGRRVLRGTGRAPEEVAAAWREWILRTGRRVPVEAGFRWIAAALIATVAIAALATRSGRWRQ